MNEVNDPYYKSWLWIPKVWGVVYSIALVAAVAAINAIGPTSYRQVIGVVVFGLGVPLTFKSLVNTGCDLRFHICALVKGMIAGLLFLIFAMIADPIVWSFLQQAVAWSPLGNPQELFSIQQAWVFAGIFGGFAARVVEVKRMTATKGDK